MITDDDMRCTRSADGLRLPMTIHIDPVADVDTTLRMRVYGCSAQVCVPDEHGGIVPIHMYHALCQVGIGCQKDGAICCTVKLYIVFISSYGSSEMTTFPSFSCVWYMGKWRGWRERERSASAEHSQSLFSPCYQLGEGRYLFVQDGV